MLSGEIQKRICKYASSKGYICAKISAANLRGMPDIIMIGKQGSTFFIEFKNEGEKLKPHQSIKKEKLEFLGHRCYVVRELNEGIEIIKNEIIRLSRKSCKLCIKK